MASNVFGIPITDQTLRGMPNYANKPEITAVDRAEVAVNMKNAQNKDVNVRTYVENLKAQYGYGVSTLCVFYNATGNTITFYSSRDWYGHIGSSPYPMSIENGQWGGFLHVHDTGAASGSMAAVVYDGIGYDGTRKGWAVGWDNPWSRLYQDNRVYTEVGDIWNYDYQGTWDTIFQRIEGSDLSSYMWSQGCYTTATTGSDTSPILEAVFTLKP